MIPALASCFFVAYLYLSLRAKESVGESSTDQNNQPIETRISELSQRVEKLANQVDQGDKS